MRSACEAIGVSTTTFYKYLDRFQVEGVAGFYPRSRRPRSSPSRLVERWEEEIVRARKELMDAGWDAGADQIRFRLHDQHDPDRLLGEVLPGLPSRATINRVLARRGQLVSVPQRRPRRADRRFEAAHPNGRWQMDGFAYPLAGGRPVTVLHVVDDCSRFEIALQAAVSENAADVWSTIITAATRHGLPAELLTDNGTAFSGRRRGWDSALEVNLRALGVRTITSSIAHPQTCGKVERAHQPVQRWLTTHGPYQDLPGLQAALDVYREEFNNHRRKSHLGGMTPAQRYALGPIDGPTGPIGPPFRVLTVKVCAYGKVTIDKVSVYLGRAHAGKSLTLFRRGNTITIFDANILTAEFELDHRRRYQSLTPQTHNVTAKS